MKMRLEMISGGGGGGGEGGLIMMMRITVCRHNVTQVETNYVKFPDIHILNYVGNGVTGIVTIIRHRDRL